MITAKELLFTLLVPLLLSSIVLSLAYWRRLTWTAPIASAAGFLAGYSLLDIPGLPPRDGTDWLYWVSIPLAAFALLDTPKHRRWSWALGATTGAATFVVVLPLVRAGSLSTQDAIIASIALAFAAAAVCLALDLARTRVGLFATTAALALTLFGAAVLILSSHLRIVALYALAAAAAMTPLPLFALKLPLRGAALFAVPLLGAFLAAGHYYPDAGVTWPQAAMLLAAPLLIWAGAIVPTRKTWLRAVVALLAVATLIGIATIPTALKAKQEADADPYSAYQ